MSLVAQQYRICLQCRRRGFDLWVGKIPLAKEMAAHSSILAWKVPWTEEPGRLQSIGLHTHKLCPYMGWEGLQPLSDEAMSRVVMAGTKGRLPQAP